MAKAYAPAHGLYQIAALAHHLCPAGNGGLSIAQLDQLGRTYHCLQAAATQAIDGQGRGTIGHARAYGNTARDIHIARFGMDNMAKNTMPNFLSR